MLPCLRSRLWLLLLLIALAGCGPSPRPPNVLFISVDDLGWKDAGFMGSTYYETPNIDRLASQGMRFTQAYANAPNCAPSRAALLSGMYAPRTGIYTVGSAERGESERRRLIPVSNRTALDTGVVTIAEALGAVGYTTGHIYRPSPSWRCGTRPSPLTAARTTRPTPRWCRVSTKA